MERTKSAAAQARAKKAEEARAREQAAARQRARERAAEDALPGKTGRAKSD